MANRDEKAHEVENFEKRRDYMREESAGAHHDGAEFPSSEDVLSSRGERDGAADLPAKDETASEAETPAEDLHGSLHGRWNATEDAKR